MTDNGGADGGTPLVISSADVKAIAKAVVAEAAAQVVFATGRGVWATLKTMFFPVLIGLVLWWLAGQGKPIALADVVGGR